MPDEIDVLENKALVRTYYEELSNQQRYDQAERIIAPGFCDHSDSRHRLSGVAGLLGWLRYLHSAFPDLNVKIAEMVAEGDRVATRNIWTGTHFGDFLGVPASGRKVTFSGMVHWRVAGHKLVERWSLVDRFGLVQQLRG